MVVRGATEADLAAVADIQGASSEAAQWTVADYLNYDCLVAEYVVSEVRSSVVEPLVDARGSEPSHDREGVVAQEYATKEGAAIAGFLVCRSVAQDEREILNLAVHPRYRRRGIARMLLEAACNRNPAHYFLEVRASNKVARTFYSVMGFTEEGIRSQYYENPPESGIVMKRGSCYRHSCQETARGQV